MKPIAYKMWSMGGFQNPKMEELFQKSRLALYINNSLKI